VNWDFVGGSRGAYIIRAAIPAVSISDCLHPLLFLLMIGLAVIAILTGAHDRALAARLRLRHHSRRRACRRGCGVPTLRLKLIATTISARLMGMAGASVPLLQSAISSRASAFGLAYAVNSIAMPMIGGTTSWVGPLIGALPSRHHPAVRRP
jgi:branched-chain amino acid transport system permease protein